MEYKFNEIEKKWQDKWKADKVYKVENNFNKPKYYVLDMFPYPSGAGLHVGHPLGYIASDIYSRYKRLKGFNVLHPMGFDSFGLPAEQYALETGQHPAETTKKNIATFKAQLDKIGFCYDWEREVQTSDPNYYKWTQWIFLQLFNSYFDSKENKAKPIENLVRAFELEGCANSQLPTANSFTAEEWNAYNKKEQEDILMQRRLAFSKYGEVNWCEVLGTVLANDEVVNGVSERGGHPVVKKKMRQWYLRITAYADRLLEGLETVEFSDSMKEMQRNWIGRSEGAEIQFDIISSKSSVVSTELTTHHSPLTVYTTRPDTIFGVDFMVVAPELDLVQQIKTTDQTAAVDEYIAYVKSRSDVDRMAEKKITGCFTGAYAVNPFNGKQIPIWISEYVLAGYGTGAIMGVPCGDERDFKFAQHFNIPITNIIGSHFKGQEANPTKEVPYSNSEFVNGMKYAEAAKVVIDKLEEKGIGKRKVNYRMRDAGFSRQRYWGEPFPIIWNDGVAVALEEIDLPLELPHVDKYGPGPEGEGPLGNLKDWVKVTNGLRETSTMPGYAGSSWYFLRYMDPHNATTFCDKKVSDYWNQVDLYVGGTEHAVGHLLYSRLWTKILFDLGHIGFDEPFKKLLNQGMITGKSYFLSFSLLDNKIVSYKIGPVDYEFIRLKYGHQFVDNLGKITKSKFDEAVRIYKLEIDKNIEWENDGVEDYIILKEESEKMSKSKFNVDNPDELCEKYGADTFRMYEMFLGPVEASKPWDTKGIEGVHRFLRKLWRLFNDDIKGKIWVDEKPTEAELKILHRTIKKIEEDTEKFSFNTAVSAFMICVNDLADAKCYKKEILEKVLILLVPYAPHIAEELWHQVGNSTTILDAEYPTFDPSLLVESSKEYPVSINGKVRTNISLALSLEQADVEEIILQNETIQKWLEGKSPKKIIYVKNKMINIVV
jgi:leucyl-tRNA synthetase